MKKKLMVLCSVLFVAVMLIQLVSCSVCDLQPPPPEETPVPKPTSSETAMSLPPSTNDCVKTSTPTPVQSQAKTQNLMQNITARTVVEVEPDANFVEHTTDFSIELFQKTYLKEKNTLLSPVSALIALAMTANGAGGETLAQMERVLGGTLSIDQLNAYYYYFLNGFRKTDKLKMTCANSIWFRDTATFTPRQGFLQKNADYYDASVYKSAFDDQTLQDINQWVTEKTNGMIENILDEIPADAMLYIINTLAFEGTWKEAYSENAIREGTFTNYRGERQSVEMMYSTEERYLDDGRATGFVKDYVGGQYSFVALLPNAGVSLDNYVASLTGDGLRTLLKNAQSTDVKVAIPKFSYAYDVFLNPSLMEMGMTDAFSVQLADFSNMEENAMGSDLYISRVIHKTFISVDEAGTQAGAATIIEVPTKDYGPTKTYTVYLTRPFVYAIVDNATGIPVFLGTVVDLG